jgi:hypothetical protein
VVTALHIMLDDPLEREWVDVLLLELPILALPVVEDLLADGKGVAGKPFGDGLQEVVAVVELHATADLHNHLTRAYGRHVVVNGGLTAAVPFALTLGGSGREGRVSTGILYVKCVTRWGTTPFW